MIVSADSRFLLWVSELRWFPIYPLLLLMCFILVYDFCEAQNLHELFYTVVLLKVSFNVCLPGDQFVTRIFWALTLVMRKFNANVAHLLFCWFVIMNWRYISWYYIYMRTVSFGFFFFPSPITTTPISDI